MRKLVFLCAALLAACAPGPVTVRQAMASCARGANAVEVTASGTVGKLLGNYRSRTGVHEGFVVNSSGFQLHVENNTTITGPIPLTIGEPVSLQGQYECNDGVIHWTHHDPRFRHVGGFITAGGKTYR